MNWRKGCSKCNHYSLMPRQFSLTEINEVVTGFKHLTKKEGRPRMEAYAILAERHNRSVGVIQSLIRRFQPSVVGAEEYLRSNAMRLAMRVVRKANVDQAIDILERSNVGVLAPKKEVGSGNQGFFLSVQAENLGAVRIGVVSGEAAALQMPGGIDSPSAPYSGASGEQEIGGSDHVVIDSHRVLPDPDGDLPVVGPEQGKTLVNQPGVPHPNQGTFGRFTKPREEWGKRHQQEMENHRQRLTEARRLAALMRNRESEEEPEV